MRMEEQGQGQGQGFNDLARHASRAVEASSCLGYQLWWDLSGNRISHDDLTSLASTHGLDASYLPQEIKASSAFRRAWRAIANRVGEGLVLREIGENKEAIVIALVREHTNTSAKTYAGQEMAVVTFDKKTHATTIENRASDVPPSFEVNVRRAIVYFSAHTTQDVRAMITNFASKHGVMLSQHGGHYFVPAKHEAMLNALCQVVEACSQGNATYLLPVADSAKARETMARVATTGLAEEIRQLEGQIDAFDLTKARENTLSGKIDEFDAMRARVSMFASVLNLKAGDLTTRLDALRARISHVLAGGSPETAPAITLQPAPQPEIEAFDAEAGF